MNPVPSASPAPSPEPVAPEGSEPEATGYELVLCVYPDSRFGVKKRPLSPEGPVPGGKPMAGNPEDQTFPDIGAALKQLVTLYEQHPISGGEQENMVAAFGSDTPKGDADLAAGYEKR